MVIKSFFKLVFMFLLMSCASDEFVKRDRCAHSVFGNSFKGFDESNSFMQIQDSLLEIKVLDISLSDSISNLLYLDFGNCIEEYLNENGFSGMSFEYNGNNEFISCSGIKHYRKQRKLSYEIIDCLNKSDSLCFFNRLSPKLISQSDRENLLKDEAFCFLLKSKIDNVELNNIGANKFTMKDYALAVGYTMEFNLSLNGRSFLVTTIYSYEIDNKNLIGFSWEEIE